MPIMHDSHAGVCSSEPLYVAKNCRRRIQCHDKTVSRTRRWSSWAGRRELVWQSPKRRHRREPRWSSSPATQHQFREPLNQSVEKHRDGRLTSRTKRLWRVFSPSLAPSITWYSLQVTACTCTSLLIRNSSKQDAHLNCVTGLHLPRSNLEVRKFATVAQSFSQRELLVSARRADG